MPSEYASQQTVFMSARRLHSASKRRCSGRLACVLFPIIHLLLELLGFFLVNKRQPG